MTTPDAGAVSGRASTRLGWKDPLAQHPCPRVAQQARRQATAGARQTPPPTQWRERGWVPDRSVSDGQQEPPTRPSNRGWNAGSRTRRKGVSVEARTHIPQPNVPGEEATGARPPPSPPRRRWRFTARKPRWGNDGSRLLRTRSSHSPARSERGGFHGAPLAPSDIPQDGPQHRGGAPTHPRVSTQTQK